MKKHKLRRWRESFDKTVTLDELAGNLGISKSMLSEIENWKKKPSLDLACKLAKITKIPVCDFNEEPEAQSSTGQKKTKRGG